MMASVTVTRTGDQNGPADDGRVSGHRTGPVKLVSVKWCWRLLVNGFTVQKAVTSMTTSDAR